MRKLIFLGDSLTAGYGLQSHQAYPTLFAEHARGLELPVRVFNAGVNGDTTGGGLRRLPRLLREEPYFVVVALGANDMLRGVAVSEVRANLRQMIRQTRDAGAQPILFGMEAHPFHGLEYMAEFNELYPALAREHAVPLHPFFIRNVALQPHLNLPDQIHPNAAGHRVIAEGVIEFLIPLVGKRDAETPVSLTSEAPNQGYDLR